MDETNGGGDGSDLVLGGGTNMLRQDPFDWQSAMQLAEQLCTSELVPKAIRGKPADALVILLTGRELRIGPMQALRLINVIEGKAAMSAELITALCTREPTICKWFQLVQSDATSATYRTQRAGNPEPITLSFTMSQAQRAGLTSKQNWQRWPDAMLRARAASALARAVYPDLVGGLYDPDELEELEGTWTPPPEPALDAANEPPTTRTQQVKAKVQQRAAQAAPQPPPAPAQPAPVVAQFGGPSFKGKALADMNTAQLERLIQIGEENLAKDPAATYAPSVRANMVQIRAVLAAKQAELATQPTEAEWEPVDPAPAAQAEPRPEPGSDG